MFSAQQLIKSIETRLNRRKKNRAWLSFSYISRQIATNLSFFYLPLFLFEQAQHFSWWGWSLNDIQKGMIVIAAFYLTERLIGAVFSLVQAQFSIKIGHDWSMVLGTFSYIGFLICFAQASSSVWLMVAGAILAGLQLVFYWPSYNTLITRLSYKNHMGRSLGGFIFLQNMASMLSPTVGGLVILFLGYDYLFYISVVFLLISLIGLFQLDLQMEKDEVSIKEYLEWMKEKSFVKLSASQSGRYFYDASITLWPLYVYLLLGNVEKVGYIYSLSIFLAMIVGLLAGYALDKKRQKTRKPFYLSGGFLSTLSIMRMVVGTVWGVVIVDACSRVVANFHWLFNDRILHTRGKGSQEFSYFVYYALNRALGATLFWLVLLLFFFLVPIGWIGLFMLGSLGVLLSLMIQEVR